VDTGSREENASNLVGRQPMDEAEKERNREIAQNEAERQTTGDIRVSAWTIVFSVLAGVIVFAIVWAWLSR
jgi:Flp pilus assembly protein TadB